MFGDLTSLVVDIGTAKTRVGYGGDDAPKLTVSSHLVRSIGMELENQKYLAGDKHLYRDRPHCQIQSIFDSKSYSFNKERLECFLQSLLRTDLQANVNDYSILFSEDIGAKTHQMRSMRAMLSELVFEKLNASNIYFLKSPVLCCFATGRSTATVLDSGHSFTRTAAVHDGFCLMKTAKVVGEAGRTLSASLQSYIQNMLRCPLRASSPQSTQSYHQFHLDLILNDIKESMSVGKGEEQEPAPYVEYELPDRQKIKLDRKEMREVAVRGVMGGMAKQLGQTIEGNDVDIKKELYGNVLFTGGNMLYDGVGEDVMGGLGKYSPPNVKIKQVNVCSSTERKNLAWIGGSIVTSLSSFQSYWVGGQEWREMHSTILDKKCV